MEFKKSISIYEQIANSIQENIIDEVWQAGDRIPSVRETAGKIQVNPNTVMRTYSLLQKEGIIFNKRGIGFFIADDAIQKTIRMQKDKFNTQMLPEFFKMIDKLKINFDELKDSYNLWKSQNN
jgi:DNA-binding transcriptional regulator YhcF (GntR family)